MDRIYNCSKDSELLKKQIELCEKRAKLVVSVPRVKKVVVEKPKQFMAKDRARLVLNLGN